MLTLVVSLAGGHGCPAGPGTDAPRPRHHAGGEVTSDVDQKSLYVSNEMAPTA